MFLCPPLLPPEKLGGCGTRLQDLTGFRVLSVVSASEEPYGMTDTIGQFTSAPAGIGIAANAEVKSFTVSKLALL